MGWAESIGALITVICTGACSVILAMTKWQADKVKDRDIKIGELETRIGTLEGQREKDQGVIKSALRHIRDRIVHSALLVGLLQLHAPGVTLPPEPALPDELRNEI